MSLQDEMKINQNIQVKRADSEEEWYLSSVQDINDYEFCVSVPTNGPHPLVLHNGNPVTISLVSGMSRIEFNTRVTGWRYDNIPMYVLALSKEYKRVQLREFVRIPIVLDVYYAGIPDEGQKPVFKQCNSLDLSGGGIRLALKEKYSVNTRLILKFNIPFKKCSEEVEAIGRVVRLWTDPNVKLYQNAVQFANISRRQQDLIVRFILEKMTEQRHVTN